MPEPGKVHTTIAKLYHEYNITATFRLEEDYTGLEAANFIAINFANNLYVKMNILEENKFETEFTLLKQYYDKPQSYVLPRNLEKNETVTIRLKQIDDVITLEIGGFELAMFRNKNNVFTNVPVFTSAANTPAAPVSIGNALKKIM